MPGGASALIMRDVLKTMSKLDQAKLTLVSSHSIIDNPHKLDLWLLFNVLIRVGDPFLLIELELS